MKSYLNLLLVFCFLLLSTKVIFSELHFKALKSGKELEPAKFIFIQEGFKGGSQDLDEDTRKAMNERAQNVFSELKKWPAQDDKKIIAGFDKTEKIVGFISVNVCEEGKAIAFHFSPFLPEYLDAFHENVLATIHAYRSCSNGMIHGTVSNDSMIKKFFPSVEKITFSGIRSTELECLTKSGYQENKEYKPSELFPSIAIFTKAFSF